MGDTHTDDLRDRLRTVLAREVVDFDELQTAERLSGGANQETYRVETRCADGPRRFALRRAAGGVGDATMGLDLATEARLVRAAREAGVPEPRVVYVLTPEDGLGQGFLMEWLEGETLGSRIVRAPELADVRPKLARQCGEILARIHAIDLEAVGLADALPAFTPDRAVHDTWDRYKALPTAQPMIDFTARWLLDHLPRDVELGLVHGDFRNGNLMVRPDGIAAVLDWELAHVGDPMRDLGWLCTNSWRFGRRDEPVGGFGDYDDLFAGYESVSGRAIDPAHVRFWEVFGSFWWAVGCLTMAEHYRTGPDKTVERPAIGRRSSECQVDCVNLLIPGTVEGLPTPAEADPVEMPTAGELLASVGDFLRQDITEATGGRTRFLARVAANSVDIVRRELAMGPALGAREATLLRSLFDSGDDRAALRWRLVRELRDGSMPLDRPGLAGLLRETVVHQVAIDQPRYSGYRHAIGELSPGSRGPRGSGS